jgi:hypothetical protein
MMLVAALGMVPGVAAAQANNARGPARSTYQEHDQATNTTLAATLDAAGNAVLSLKGGDFSLEKVIAHTGDTTVRLSQGTDVVTIAINQTGFQIRRGSRTRRLDPRSNDASKVDAVRSMLVGSQAVGSFKRLVVALEERDQSEDDGPLALSTLIDGAIVLMLDGDIDAPRRIAKRITRTQRAGLRAVKAKRAPGVYYDCVGGYQVALMTAWGQFASCSIEAGEYSWWTRGLVFQLCEWEWALRSYQYIWQFIGCFMLPF